MVSTPIWLPSQYSILSFHLCYSHIGFSVPWISTLRRCFSFQGHSHPSNQLAPQPSDLTQASLISKKPFLELSAMCPDSTVVSFCTVSAQCLVCTSQVWIQPWCLASYSVPLGRLLSLIKIMITAFKDYLVDLKIAKCKMPSPMYIIK